MTEGQMVAVKIGKAYRVGEVVAVGNSKITVAMKGYTEDRIIKATDVLPVYWSAQLKQYVTVSDDNAA